MTQRTERVGDLIRTELAELIQREVRDPRVGLATVSSVDVARDFSHATVKVSVLGTETERLESVAALEPAQPSGSLDELRIRLGTSDGALVGLDQALPLQADRKNMMIPHEPERNAVRHQDRIRPFVLTEKRSPEIFRHFPGERIWLDECQPLQGANGAFSPLRLGLGEARRFSR
jgi:hypothetical protein